MPTVEATFTDPDAVRIETPSGVWFLLGMDNADDASVHALTSTGDAVHFCRKYRDALVVFIEQSNGTAQRLQAWKGIFSGRELFFTVRPSQDVVLSDHMVNVLAALPPKDRLPDEQSLIDHYLFRKPYGRMTYSAAITRLSHAEHLEIELLSGKVRWSLFDRVEADTEPRSPAEYVTAIDVALARSLDRIPADGSTALLFSGGVDSTLLMTYLRDSAQPVTFVPDTPEFSVETRYAREASSLIGMSLDEIPTPESEFVEMLEVSTDMLGTPAFDDATAYFDRLILSQPYGDFVSGVGADSAFGMSLKIARFASWFRFPGIRGALSSVAPHVPGHLGYRMRQVAPIAGGFARNPMDPHGFAGNARLFGDTSLFQSTVDPSLVTEAKAYELEYVTQRIERTAAVESVFLSHIELAHWMLLFGNPTMLERMVAHARGKRIIAPYADSRVLAELIRIPIDERYVRGLRAKWLLKDLLGQRLPGYPTDQRKKATALPYERFYNDGPLTTFWDHYDVPDVFTGKNRDALVGSPSTSTWNAITYAIWEKRVAKNPDLQPHEAHLVASFTVGSG